MKFFFAFFILLFFATATFSSNALEGKKVRKSDTLVNHDFVVINKIILIGNKITKDRIIYRELIFRENDTIVSSELEEKLQQSRKNLVNTSLFNFVTISSVSVKDSVRFIDVTIEFIERWYVWPVPIFEFADRNFNEWLKKMDWSRLNYGVFLTWNNFRGRREKLILYARFGYDQKYEVAYKIPYINKKQTWGMGFAGGLSQNHEIPYNSVDNKEVYYKSEEFYPKREVFGYTEAYYRKEIHSLSLFKLGYQQVRLSDSVMILNPDYMFGTANQNEFLSFYYQYQMDYRDYRQYPLTGYYFDAQLDKRGLGVFNDPSVNTLSLKANFRKYFNLKGRFYYTGGFTGKISPFYDQPYYYMEGLGYGRDYVRGYEYYVIDGEHFAILKNNLKFELLPMRVLSLNFIPTDKFSELYYAFYLNLFTDIGYAVDNRNIPTNPLANEFLVGYGIGLDFVTYYDFVIRFEYSFNNNGESGFFIHFMPSI